MRKPVHGLLHGPRTELTRDGAAGLGAGNQAGIREHIEVLHDRREGHREWLGQLANRHRLAFAQAHQDRAPCRVGQGAEGAVERLI
jgi:di/tripeptidase